jgi:hypothetical protein
MQIALKCVNCGAALQVREGVSELACGYCSVVQAVQREGGGVWLSLEKAISEVKATADRTATELTLRRLSEEREAANERGDAMRARAAEAGNHSMFSALQSLLIGVFLIGAILIASGSWEPEFFRLLRLGSSILGFGIIILAIFVVATGAVAVRNHGLRADAVYEAERIDEQIADFDQQIEETRRRVGE